MGRLIGVLLACALWPGVVAAGWKGHTTDDGALFYGIVRTEAQGLWMSCIGPSRGGVSPIEVGAHETSLSPVYGFNLALDQTLFSPQGNVYQRSDFVIWVDGTGYQLPLASLNEMEGGWDTKVAMTDPLVTALLGAGDVIAGPISGPHYRFPVDGLQAALREVLGFCVAEYARLGHSVPPALQAYQSGSSAPPASAPVASGAMVAVADAAIRQGCGGDFTHTAGRLPTANIDGDGIDDVVIDWGEITCAGPYPRPNCGAALCSVDLFVSALHAATSQPESMLSLGAELIPLTNGLMGVKVRSLPQHCQAAGQPCEATLYWTGTGLERLP